MHSGQPTGRPLKAVHGFAVCFFAGRGEFYRALRLWVIKLSDCDLMFGHASSIVPMATDCALVLVRTYVSAIWTPYVTPIGYIVAAIRPMNCGEEPGASRVAVLLSNLFTHLTTSSATAFRS